MIRRTESFGDYFARHRAHLSLAVVLGGFSALAVWVSISIKWKTLVGDAAISPVFADLRLFTSNADCVTDDSWAIGSAVCDPFDRPYNYPSQLPRILNALGLGYESSGILGIALLFVFVLFSGLLLYSTRGPQLRIAHVSLGALCLFSPPVMILIERGSSDILVYSVLVASGLALAGRKFVSAGLMVVLGTGFKLYPLGAVVAFMTVNRKHRWVVTSLVILGGALVTLLNLSEWLVIVTLTPRPYSEGGFGSEIVVGQLLYFLGIDSYLFARIAGPAVFISFGVVLSIVIARFPKLRLSAYLRSVADSLEANPRNKIFFALGSGALLGGYILASSYDYRLTLLLMPILALSGLKGGQGATPTLLTALMVSLMYLSFGLPSGYLLVGDFIGFATFVCLFAILARLSFSRDYLGNAPS